MNDAAAAAGDNFLRVGIRIRPLNDREQLAAQHSAWAVQDNRMIYPVGLDGKPLLTLSQPFSFDRIFEEETTSEIYQQMAKELIMSSVQGFNATIFAYGQTSSGKTFTMQGISASPGVIPLAVSDVFGAIIDTPGREFLIRVSYLEIYNEIIKDLLNPERDNLKIHETPDREIFVGNLTEEIVSCPDDVAQVLIRGERNRHVGVTNMNERSSRSHTIFRMIIESRERPDSKGSDTVGAVNDAVKVSVLNLVDLAGSERAGQTGAEGIRLKEGGHINKSLLALSSVIQKLYEGNDSHIPYRDSKLTRILQPSLGGNAKTAIICTITPASRHFEDSLSTLKFASRAKAVRNKPEINEIISDQTMLKRYRKEINSLKRQLEELQTDEMQKLVQEKLQVEAENEKYQQETSYLQEKIEKMTSLILNESSRSITQKRQKTVRRQTWFPGVAVGNAPLPEVINDRDIEDNQPLKSVNTDAVNDCKAQLQQPGRRSFGLVSEQKRIIAELKGELKQQLAEKESLIADFQYQKQEIAADIRRLIERSPIDLNQASPEIQELHLWINGLVGRIEYLAAELDKAKQKFTEELGFLEAESSSFRKSYAELEREAIQYRTNYAALVEKNDLESKKICEINEELQEKDMLLSENNRLLAEYQTKVERLTFIETELTALRESFSAQLDEAKTENNNFKTAYYRLEQRLADEVESKSQLFSCLSTKLESHGKAIEAVAEEVDSVFTVIEELNAQGIAVSKMAKPVEMSPMLKSLGEHCSSLNRDVFMIEEKLEYLNQAQGSFVDSFNSSVKLFFYENNHVLASKDVLISSLQVKLDLANQKINSIELELSQSLQKFEVMADKSLAEKDSKIKELESINAELRLVQKKLEGQIEFGKSIMLKEQKEISELTEDKKALQSQLDEIQDCLHKEKAKAEEVLKENKSFHTSVSEGRIFVNKANARIEALELEKSRILAETEERQKEAQVLHETVRDLSFEKAELSRQTKELQKRCQELDLVNLDLEKSEINLNIALKENKRLTFELSDVSEELRKKEEFCLALKQSNTFDQKELDEQRRLISKLEIEGAQLRAEKLSLEQQIENLLETKLEAERSLHDAKATHGEEVDRLQLRLDAVEKTLKSTLEERDLYIERLQLNCNKLMTEVDYNDLTPITELKERFLQKITLLEAEKISLAEQVKKLQAENDSINSQLIMSKAGSDQERRAVADRDNRLKALSREHQALAEVELNLRQMLHQKSTEISRLNEELQSLTEQLLSKAANSEKTETVAESVERDISRDPESRVLLLQEQLQNAKQELAAAKKETRTMALLKSQESTRLYQLETEFNRAKAERDRLAEELKRYKDSERSNEITKNDNSSKQAAEIKQFSRTFTNQENKRFNQAARPVTGRSATRTGVRINPTDGTPDIPQTCTQQ